MYRHSNSYLLDPLDESIAHIYVILIKYRATGVLVTAPLPNKKEITVRNAFMQNYVGHYGVPQIVTQEC